MPIVWTHAYVLRPTEVLRKELEAFSTEAPMSRLTDAQLWLAPTVGDHDYEGQGNNSITRMKLVFLADIHRRAQVDEDSEDRQIARKLVAQLPLTEEFFDERWTVEDLGPFSNDVDRVTDTLRPENMRAVEGPDRHIPSNFADNPGTSVRQQWRESAERQAAWREELADFCHTAVVMLCRRYDQSEVVFRERADIGLDVEQRLAANGITVANGSPLTATIEPGHSDDRKRKLEFSLWPEDSQPRRGARAFGAVLGRRDYKTGEWSLQLQTNEWVETPKTTNKS